MYTLSSFSYTVPITGNWNLKEHCHHTLSSRLYRYRLVNKYGLCIFNSAEKSIPPTFVASSYLFTFMEPRNRFRGIDFANLCSMAGRYAKYVCHTGPPGWESIPGLLERFLNSEPVFLSVYGAPESIPRNEFRQPWCLTTIDFLKIPELKLTFRIRIRN